jgi:tetratricopeptide (TPR) repeat protein
LLCALGGYLQSLGRSDLAVKAYDVCYRHGQIEPRLWHLPDIREVAAGCQAAILEVSGHMDQARELLQDARQAYPDSPRIVRQLLEHHVQQGRRDEALLVASQMPADADARESLRVAIVGACAAVKGNWIAARSYLQSAVEGGCLERFAWRWLATSLLALGDASQAEEILARWETLDPASPEPAQFRRSLPPAVPSVPKTLDAAGRSLRIDAPQDAAAGPSLAPSTSPASVSRSVP